MFGYIGVNRALLREEEKCIYRGFYCGLCRELGSLFGRKAQTLLNYDMTFLIVLLSGLYEPEERRKEFTCAMHPLRRKTSLSNEITEYAACMNVMLAYQNLVDDWKDQKKHAKHAFARMLESDYRTACARYPRQQKVLESYMRDLAACERAMDPNPDTAADLTGRMLGGLFVWKEDEWQDELETLGLFMGRFIYLMDAYEDLKEDAKSGGYNPLLRLQGVMGEEFEPFFRELLEGIAAACAQSFERLPILRYAGILRNILYSGMWSKYAYLQKKRKRKRNEEETYE